MVSSHSTADTKSTLQGDEASHSFILGRLLENKQQTLRIASDEKPVSARGCNQVLTMQLQLQRLINSMWIISLVKKKETVDFSFQLSSESNGNIKRRRGGGRLSTEGSLPAHLL